MSKTLTDKDEAWVFNGGTARSTFVHGDVYNSFEVSVNQRGSLSVILEEDGHILEDRVELWVLQKLLAHHGFMIVKEKEE